MFSRRANNDLLLSPNLSLVNHPELFGMDPLFWTHLKLFNSFILGMKKVENCTENLLANVRPVAYAHVVGVLVAQKIQSRPSRSVFVVDDGTELIDCLYWHEDDALSPRRLDLGSLVRAMGRVELPREVTKTGRRMEQR